jgi:hypothetical protein
MEEPVNIVIRRREQALFPELWGSSGLARFTYRVSLTGFDDAGHPIRAEGDPACR